MRSILRAAALVAAAPASVAIFLAVDARSHSASDTLSGVVVPIGLVWLLAFAVITPAGRTMRTP